MRLSRAAAALLAVLITSVCRADERPAIRGAVDRDSYSLGYQIGGDLARESGEIDVDALRRGMIDALASAEPALSPSEMNSILVSLKRRIQARQRERAEQTLEQNRAGGRAFLAENAGKQGVISLPSGLQYRVLREGAGRRPGPSDQVEVHYRGSQIDGSQFSSSGQPQGETATFRVDGVIAGWTEALQLMREGAKWRLFIPAELAYAARGPMAHRVVIYDIELISVEPAE